MNCELTLESIDEVREPTCGQSIGTGFLIPARWDGSTR